MRLHVAGAFVLRLHVAGAFVYLFSFWKGKEMIHVLGIAIFFVVPAFWLFESFKNKLK
jgi:hypothetical protein